MQAEKKLGTRDLALLSVYGALMMAAQVAMAPLPNIEPVTPLLMCCALVYGRLAFYPCGIFVLLEGLIYGFGPWFVNYLYVWPILICTVLLLRKVGSFVVWTIVAGAFGLCFGALCAIPYFFIGGWEMGFSYWVAGIPFDLLHCVGNAVMSALLLKPLTLVLGRLSAPDGENHMR